MNVERYIYTPQLYRPNERRKLFINKKHLDWVRGLRCFVSGQTQDGYEHIDAHHLQLKSQGQNDYTAVPLAHPLHDYLHSGCESGDAGVAHFENKHGVDFKDALIATLVRRIMILEGRIEE